MELWFVYAVASVILSGIQAFIFKIAAQRNHDADANTAISAFVSAGIGLTLILFFGLWHGAWSVIFTFATVGGLLYSFGAAARVNSLKYIDTTIFFPIYKTVGPILVIFAGILLFRESLNTLEIIGVLLSIAVPLLLLHKDESTRQQGLLPGLVLLGLSVALIVIAHVVNKYALDISDNVLLFVTVSHVATFVFSSLLWYKHHIKEPSAIQRIPRDVILLSALAGIFQFSTFYTFLKALELGALGIVFTINSLYIVIPIILSVWWYKEHFNLRKAAAVILSILALAFLG